MALKCDGSESKVGATEANEFMPRRGLPDRQRGSAVRFAACVLGLVFLEAVAPASSAGQYDGRWVGTAPEAGDCGVLTVTMMIGSNTITGFVSGKHGSPSIDSAAPYT
jgi:hypothetical protein